MRPGVAEHADHFEKFDVEGILTLAERVLPRVADLWVQASLDQRQRLQQLFFPEGVVFDGTRLLEMGTNDKLMAKRGQYAERYGIQRQRRYKPGGRPDDRLRLDMGSSAARVD